MGKNMQKPYSHIFWGSLKNYHPKKTDKLQIIKYNYIMMIILDPSRFHMIPLILVFHFLLLYPSSAPRGPPQAPQHRYSSLSWVHGGQFLEQGWKNGLGRRMALEDRLCFCDWTCVGK